MHSPLIPNHFLAEELTILKEMEGKQLARVVYTIWKNVAAKEGAYEALDWVELVFADGSKFDFTAGEETDGIHLRDFNFGLEQTRILQQFQGQVELDRVGMNESSVWKSAIGERLVSVGLLHDFDQQFQNHILQLEFGSHLIEFSLGEEGLIVNAS